MATSDTPRSLSVQKELTILFSAVEAKSKKVVGDTLPGSLLSLPEDRLVARQGGGQSVSFEPKSGH